MRSLELYEAATITANTTVNATAVDMSSQDIPFSPSSTAVAAFGLRAAANVTINLQKSELSSGDTDWTTVASHTATTAETRQVFFDRVEIGQRMRLQTVGATSAAGSVDCNLLGS